MEREIFLEKIFVSNSHSSTPVRREVGRQAGYCSLRELFLSIYSIGRPSLKETEFEKIFFFIFS